MFVTITKILDNNPTDEELIEAQKLIKSADIRSQQIESWARDQMVLKPNDKTLEMIVKNGVSFNKKRIEILKKRLAILENTRSQTHQEQGHFQAPQVEKTSESPKIQRPKITLDKKYAAISGIVSTGALFSLTLAAHAKYQPTPGEKKPNFFKFLVNPTLIADGLKESFIGENGSKITYWALIIADVAALILLGIGIAQTEK